jgi:hypothetical protein
MKKETKLVVNNQAIIPNDNNNIYYYRSSSKNASAIIRRDIINCDGLFLMHSNDESTTVARTEIIGILIILTITN